MSETITALPKKFKEKWLAALRSGKYKPTDNNMLFDGTCYCPLAIGCKVIGIPDETLKGGYFPNTRLSTRIPNYFNNDKGNNAQWQGDIINMPSRKSFKQVANWIEKNL